MSEGESGIIDASAHARELAGQNSILDPPLSSAERWKLIKLELMAEVNGEVSSKLRNALALAISVLGLFIALVAGLGYLGTTAYIQSIFKDKIEQQTKIFDSLREDIARQETSIYAEQKIFVALLQKYAQEHQAMLDLASQSIDEINKSEPLNSTQMLEFKKSLLDHINKMINLQVMWPGYKDFLEELKQKLGTIHQTEFHAVHDLFEIYPHISALNYTISRSIDSITTKEKTDQEAKSLLFEEYEKSIYPIYREAYDKFGTGWFSSANLTWSTLQPSGDLLFLSLNPYSSKYDEWREKQKQNSP